MNIKTLATAFTVSLPLVLGTAYAQTTTTPDTGNNRAADGASMQTNPTPGASDSGAAGSSTPGSSGTAAGGAAGTPGASGTTTPGASGTTTPGASGATTPGASGAVTPDASGTATMPGTAGTTTGDDARTMPGTAGQSDSAASTEAITGWSAKDDIIGKSVFNENDEKVGDIKDVIISSDGRTMYLLVGAGGFLGMGEKEVAVPFDRFERRDDRVLLSGYTKEQLKALPEVRTQR